MTALYDIEKAREEWGEVGQLINRARTARKSGDTEKQAQLLEIVSLRQHQMIKRLIWDMEHPKSPVYYTNT